MGAVYREELSANARKLIEQLLSLPQGWVTAAALAESIGVSRRTVLRELPAVEQWMQAAGAHFVRNPGKGLLLDEAPERRDALRTQLNSGDRKELSRAERRQQLLTRLLSEQEPCKTAVLARALGVSESTLSADLDELETKLHPYRVEMFRRPGVGVWLQGDASSYRRVVSALLRSSMPEKELAEVLCGRMPENEIFSTLLDTKTAEKVWAALQQFEQEEQLHLPDAGFLALAIHCTLTIQQLRQGGDKGSAPRGLRPAGNHAARLVAALNRAFGLTLPSEEAQYLELYLSAYLGAEDPWGSAQEMELRNLEAALIREMEKALHTDLSGYTSLRDDLYCHLRPMLLRVEQNIRTENPQLDTIRTDYPGLWKATRAACDAVQQQFVLPAISDDEAGLPCHALWRSAGTECHVPAAAAGGSGLSAGHGFQPLSGFPAGKRVPLFAGRGVLLGAGAEHCRPAPEKNRLHYLHRAAGTGLPGGVHQPFPAGTGPCRAEGRYHAVQPEPRRTGTGGAACAGCTARRLQAAVLCTLDPVHDRAAGTSDYPARQGSRQPRCPHPCSGAAVLPAGSGRPAGGAAASPP